MTFDRWWNLESEREMRGCETPYEEARMAFLAGQRSGFSLGTEAAAKACRDLETAEKGYIKQFGGKSLPNGNTEGYAAGIEDCLEAIRTLIPKPEGA
jgi:hypothetical protein